MLKIAIIAPSPVPFTIGGAEKLFLGLQEYINTQTKNRCELIKLPTKEHAFFDIIDSYYSFYTLDLSHFDMVISGKYPAWMVQHHNHHLYMLHPLRGLYDCYDYKRFQTEPKHEKLNKIISYMQDENATVNKLFKLLFELRQDKTIPKELLSFPGAFIRGIIHFFDTKAMQKIKSFSAISNTVAQRKEYFLPYSKVNVVYPPSNLKTFQNSSYSYFFTASRLEGAKRVDAIIKAYNKAEVNIPLKIAGSGEEIKHLKRLAANNPNIEFLGFVSDKELEKHYANAYAVIFIPQNEDYGLISIEAMKCKKPLITFTDTGGVTEFAINNKTALLSKPSIEELSKNIQKLSNDLELVKSLGANAYKKVKHINWQNCTNSLLKSPLSLTVVTTYPIYPPRGGGQNRVFYLYKNLAEYFNITIISLVHASLLYSKKEISNNLYEIQVPKTQEHQDQEDAIAKTAKIAITDIAMIDLYKLTPQYTQEITKASKASSFVITTSPYTYPLLKEYIKTPLIYESQNVEYNLKKMMLENTPYNQALLKKVYETEKECYLNSFITTACSKQDSQNFVKLYSQHKKAIAFIPNGVDLTSVEYFSPKRRKLAKKISGFNNQTIALFMGSAHKPNIDATQEIFKLAQKCPEILFIVIGGLNTAFQDLPKPPNLRFTGMISNKEKNRYLSVADIALNPMLTGSGTNLKMLEYMASGIPVITTHVGARGLDIPQKAVVKADIEEFSNYLENLFYYCDTKEAKRFTHATYSWKNIANKFKTLLNRLNPNYATEN